jgi:D-aspartate ligase
MNSISLDQSVPVLIFRIGRYPFAHGLLAAIRTLGREGVSVHTSIEDWFVPHFASRYLDRSQAMEPATADEAPDSILHKLMNFAARLKRPAVLLATDDEAALFMAEHAGVLRPHFILPSIDAGLPRMLASKRGLYEACVKHGIPTPRTVFAKSMNDVHGFLAEGQFPVIVKNSEPWLRITAPAVPSSTIVNTREELLDMATTWPSNPNAVIQEYIPKNETSDWMVHGYFGRHPSARIIYTGRKIRQWPTQAGVTTFGIAAKNEQLHNLAATFCEAVGYRGIVDMDWRLDGRDGQFKLVDFNPRIGSNFRLLVGEGNLDVVRAAHLDLTGRALPVAQQIHDRRFVVENLDLATRLLSGTAAAQDAGTGILERAWFASDDPLPFFVMALRFVATVVAPQLVSKVIARPKSVGKHTTK